MEKPSASDDSFKAFLEKIQTQNQRGFITQLLQVKAEREIAGEDNDKREEQLNLSNKLLGEIADNQIDAGDNTTHIQDQIVQLNNTLLDIKEAITGIEPVPTPVPPAPIDTPVPVPTPVPPAPIDTPASPVIEPVPTPVPPVIEPVDTPPVSPTASTRTPKPRPIRKEKPVKEVDTRGFFETFKDEIKAAPGRIRDNLIGYTPEKLNSRKKKTEVYGAGIEPNAPEPVTTTGAAPVSAPVTAKPQITGVNPESDNIRDSAEIAADYEKEDIELSKQMLGVMREQLVSLKTIQEALAPNLPGPDKSSKAKSPGSKEAAGEGGGGDGGGLDLLDALPGKGALKRAGGAVLKGAKTVGKGALSVGGSVAKFAGSGAGKLLGATAAVGMGAYTAYTGVTEAEDSKQAKLEEVQAKVESGELKPEEAAAQRKEIGNTATVEKSGAVGEGSGMAAGAIAGGMAGAKLGAVIGSVIPGAGTVIGAGIGTIAGGALGAFAGSSAGKYVGEKVGGGINAVKDFFGGPGSKAEAAKTAPAGLPAVQSKEAVTGGPAQLTKTETTTDSQFNESKFGEKDPDTFKKYQEFIGKRTEEIAQKDPSFKFDRQGAYKTAKGEAGKEARAKFKKEIDAAGAGEVKTTSSTSSSTVAASTATPGAKPVEAVSGAGLGDKANKPSTGPTLGTAATPGTVAAVAPIENVDGKKVKPGKDVDKVQQAAKEKYQSSTSEEKAASEKLKAFEKENQFDYREKPTVMQAFDDEPGTGKFKDPKKQEEYDKLKGAKQQASESKRSAGAAYTAAEGVTKTQDFTGGVQAPRPGAKGGIRDKIDRTNDSMQSDGAKIRALQKRGYTDKDLGRDDTLTDNYIKDDEGKKYPIRNLGLYEAVVKKELEAPVKEGKVVPKATVDGKPAAAAKGATFNSAAASDKEFEAANADQDATEKYARRLDEIAMAEAKKGGRATPDLSDRRAAQIIARREAIKTAGAGVTEGTIKGLEVTPDGVLKGGKVSKAGQEVAKTTTENTDMEREASRGGGNNNTIVSNNVNNNNTTKFVPMKPTARPEYTGSALDRHANRISVY